MGECRFNIADIKNGKKEWDLIKNKKNGTKKSKGKLILNNIKTE